MSHVCTYIEEIPELSDVQIEMKAFQLDPTAGVHATGDTQTRFAHKYGLSLEHAGRSIEHISGLGRAEGLDFRYATTLFTNTMDAHRLTKLAQSKSADVADRVSEALYKAYFTENKELADHDLLQQIGEKCGLDAEEVRALLTSDQYKEDVLLDEREAARYGINAVPYFVIGRYAIPGAQDTEGMKNVLRKALEEESAAADTEPGMSCGPDGCRIR
ncbi:MAG: DsbA family oxidoreductase [Lachnospiraceae bacterium]|nr:DsbA family oxidoreductase [Lachnospiraceae bacterium]